MDVTLTSELERFVRHAVATGRYASPSDVVGAALRLLMRRDERLTDLRNEIAVGVADANAGQVIDGEEAFARLRTRARRSLDA